MQDLMVGMAAAACITAAAQADIVTVIATGQVAFNSITDAPLGAVGAGDSVMVTFQVDSNVFLDGVPGDTRGYLVLGLVRLGHERRASGSVS